MKAGKKACALTVAGAMLAATFPAMLATDAQAATMTEQEPNDSFETANAISVGDTVNGTFAPVRQNESSRGGSEDDYYKFTLTKSISLKLSLTTEQGADATNSCFVQLYNSQQKAIESFEEEIDAPLSSYAYFGLGTPRVRTLRYRSLPSGTYYIELVYVQGSLTQLPYRLNLGYVDFGTSLKSVKGAKKAFTAKWGKKSDASSYQVRYVPTKTYKKSGWKKAAKKTVSSSNASIKIKKLKAKTSYKVQVRVGYAIDEETVTWHSDWSAAKTVKTK